MPETYDKGYDPLQAFIELFKDVDSVGSTPEQKKARTLEERLRAHVVEGEKENLHACLDEAMQKYKPLEIVNDHLLDGMKTVGELFGSGRMQLPFVLQSAEVMKMAVAHLEPHMEKVDGGGKGSVVLATVKGDVHDIGKNLVDIILSNNGYTVHNIGIKQTLPQILEAWKATKADAIGLSGLLVKSVTVMEDNLREMSELGIDVPVILGGAALTRHYCEGHLRDLYAGKVFYGKDAFEGLRTMDLLKAGKTDVLDAEIEQRLDKRSDAQRVVAEARAVKAREQDAFAQGKHEPAAVAERSEVSTEIDVPRAPFFGSRVVEALDLDEVYPFINTTALFRGQWQFKKGAMSPQEYDAFLEDTVEPVFERLKAQLRDAGVLQPKVAYGYWPCLSDGNDLIVYHPEDHDREIERFRFPRQKSGKRLCIADFFKPVGGATKDVLGLTCVTMGSRVTDVANDLRNANNYKEYLYVHGMGVECAEALAELWHKRIRAELGIGGDDSPRIPELFRQQYRGSRYSPGYPACPDMSDQEIIWRLLGPERIGCVLTENWQIVPEQSTSAFVVHHPQAKYFNV